MASTGEVWRLGRRPALDGVRGIAILLVLVCHVAAFLLPYEVPGGAVGVDVFFVLSGFLITCLLLEEHRNSGTISTRHFYMRRARRLFPAAGVTVAVWGTLAFAAGAPLGQLGKSILVIATYTTNYFKNAERDVTLGLGHFWSLAVEEQFYVLWPVILLVLLRRRVTGARLVAIALLGAGLVAAHRAWLLTHGPALDSAFRTDTRCDALLVGVALGAACHYKIIDPTRFARVGTAALGVLCAFALTLPAGAMGRQGMGMPIVAVECLTALVILGAINGRGRVLEWLPLQHLGRLSYSLYLWHVPVIVATKALLPWHAAAQALVAIALSVLVATGSYRFVERPFLRRRESVVGRGAPARRQRVDGDVVVVRDL